jgi:hypothetical protein
MNEPIKFEYRVLGNSSDIKPGNDGDSKLNPETATTNAKKIEELLVKENPRQFSENYYINSGKLERYLPSELEKNSKVNEVYQKLKDLYQQLNEKLRSFPGNQKEAEDLIAQIDEYLLSELPELTSRITNRSLTELKKFASEQKNELIKNSIENVLSQRRGLLAEISDEDFGNDPRKLNITFPGSLREKGQARLDLLKESGDWIKKLIETDLPTESKPQFEPEVLETSSEPVQELSLEEKQQMELYKLGLERDGSDISKLVTTLDEYMKQLNIIVSRANLGDENLNRELEEISIISNNYKHLSLVLESLSAFHSAYIMKKILFDKITKGKNMSQDLIKLNQDIEKNIKDTNTENLRNLKRDIFSSWKINKSNKDRLRSLI